MDDAYFLRYGQYSRDTGRQLEKIAASLGRSEHLWDDITEKLRELQWNYDKQVIRQEFRKRNAGEIMASGYVNGCSDKAVVAATIFRMLGYPAAYVEAFEKNWLSGFVQYDEGRHAIRNHAFVDVKPKDEWITFDPLEGIVQPYIYRYREFVPFGKGLDFANIKVLNRGVHINMQKRESAFKYLAKCKAA